MTERGLPIVDGAPACPFVAFEDDRDERATSPDHRHRCYAEQTPAPRALAHQEAYCLASAFPVCPTFQDWARREAARARGAPAGVIPSQPDDEPRRNPPRDWSAPPPWAGGRPGSDDGEAVGDEDTGAPEFLAGRAGRERGLAGSPADRLASSMGRDPAAPDDAEEQHGDDVPLPGPRPGSSRQEASPAAAPAAGASALGSRAADHDDEDEEDWADEDEWEERPPRRASARRGAAGLGIGGGRPPRVGDTRRRQPDRAPAWERPRRYEAYPTLKTRVGLSMPSFGSVPSVALMAVALIVAAIALFFLPALLGLGGDDPGGVGASPSPTIATAPTPSPEPTPTPAPTQVVHVVGPGDTMSRIANQYGVSLADLIEANRETVPNPDVLNIGDQVIIPQRPPDVVPGESPAP